MTHEPYVTIFENIQAIDTPFHVPVSAVLDRIRYGKSKELIIKIRAEDNKKRRNDLKTKLPSICFSGLFHRRTDDAMIAHTGLICLDFDGYKNHVDMEMDREGFIEDAYVYAVFLSPSGNGWKVLVRIPPDPANHRGYFRSLERHFDSPHWDGSSINPSRVCYESWDTDLYLNEEALLWDQPPVPEKTRKAKTPKINTEYVSEDETVRILVSWWERRYPMLPGCRNRNAFILAIKLNEFDVPMWVCEEILMRYAEEDFPSIEISRVIASGYRDQSKRGTKSFSNGR